MTSDSGGSVLRSLMKAMLALVLLVPVAILLAVFGVPVLGIAGLLVVPVVLLLIAIGLPFLLLLVAGAVVLGLFGAVIGIGVAIISVVLKVLFFVVLPIWLVVTLARKLFGGDSHGA